MPAKAGAIVHHVNIQDFADLDLFDFSKTAQMIEAGRAAMDRYLDHPKPNTFARWLPPAHAKSYAAHAARRTPFARINRRHACDGHHREKT